MSFHFSKATSHNKTSSHVTSDKSQIIIYPKAGGRALLPSFKASLTIEAAVALPLFMFFMGCVLHFLILLFLQTNIRTHINEAARDISKKIYAASDSETAMLAATNILTIRSSIMQNGLKDKLENSQITNGSAGFITAFSGYDSECSILDVNSSYIYDFPYMPKGIATLSLYQGIKCRAWIGLELSEDSSGSAASSATSSSDKQSVYITPYGEAYHTSPSCNYLDLSIQTTSVSSVSELRNASGGTYSKCSCVGGNCSSVYVTNYGTEYHGDINCSDLKRTVEEVNMDDIGQRHACPKCAEGAH